MEPNMPPGKSAQAGFTFMAVLLAVAFLSLSSYGVIFIASTTAKRQKEQTLLKVGQAYVDAIAAYYAASPGSVKVLPQRLEDLLEDKRFIGTKRHLRQAYADPVAPDLPLQLIVDAQGGIRGVRSQSQDAPLQESPVALRGFVLNAAKSYADWHFEFVPGRANGS